jgi:UDP-3-O-[3-hydroxymyristoyl] N-acetylglucosamine deacetylase
LSALYAYGIDNIRIVVDNDEIPILDGSSSGYCLLLDEVGIKELSKPKKIIKVKKKVRVEGENGQYAELIPSSHIVYDFSIDFKHPAIGEQQFKFDYSIEKYNENISRARTFGFLHDLQYLQSIGLAQGVNLTNAIGLDSNKILNPEGLRYDDEFVRHKILDAIGDMSLLGNMMVGEYKAHAGSHDLNHKLTKALLACEDNYEIIELQEEHETSQELELAYVKQMVK